MAGYLKRITTLLDKRCLFVLLCAFSACQLKNEETLPKAKYHLLLLDQDGARLDSVDVYLFTNQAEYQQSLQDNLGRGGQRFFSANGTLDIGVLEPGTYWVQCISSETLFSTQPVTLSNSWGGYLITHHQGHASQVELEIVLKPIGGIVVFYTESLTQGASISINANGQQGSLTKSSRAAPSPQTVDGSAYVLSITESSMIYFAKNESSRCAWTDKVQVQPKNVTYVKLEACQSYKIKFSGNPGAQVYIGQDSNPVGALNPLGELEIELPSELPYSWFAEQSTCAWSGTVRLQKDTTIRLSACN